MQLKITLLIIVNVLFIYLSAKFYGEVWKPFVYTHSLSPLSQGILGRGILCVYGLGLCLAWNLLLVWFKGPAWTYLLPTLAGVLWLHAGYDTLQPRRALFWSVQLDNNTQQDIQIAGHQRVFPSRGSEPLQSQISITSPIEFDWWIAGKTRPPKPNRVSIPSHPDHPPDVNISFNEKDGEISVSWRFYGSRRR